MKINQLFRANVPSDLFIKLHRCFGYEALNQEYMFSKVELDKLDTVNRVNNLKEELCQYYIPCKAKLYLSNMSELKCITVFRQILRLFNINLISRQKYIKHKKITFYSIKFDNGHKDEHIHAMRVNQNHLVLTFS